MVPRLRNLSLQVIELVLGVGLPVIQPLLQVPITVQQRLLHLLHLPPSFGLDRLHLGHEGQVVERLGVEGDVPVNPIPACVKVTDDAGRAHEGQEIDDEAEQDEGRHKVAPDVDTLVVELEQAAEDLARRVEADAVAVRDVLVVLHVVGRLLVVSDIVALLVALGRVRMLPHFKNTPTKLIIPVGRRVSNFNCLTVA